MDKLNKVSIALIFALWFAVLSVGLFSQTPMIGDEVTHYYMLVTQSGRLPVPSFDAEIPIGADGAQKEIRHYPHTNLWHYAGAIVYRFTHSITAIQFFHSLFLLQLLAVVFLLTKRLSAADAGSPLIVLLAVASQPITLLFSVAFYQDVPAAAQVLTAFFFLIRGQWLAAAFFMAAGIGIKETTVLFLPAFFLWLVVSQWKNGWGRRVLSLIATVLILVSSCGIVAWSLDRYAQADYYPVKIIELTINKVLNLFAVPRSSTSINQAGPNVGETALPRQTALFPPEVLANHPGSLRNPLNWVIYGGGVIWVLFGLGLLGYFAGRGSEADSTASGQKQDILYLALAGVSYLLFTFLFLNIPDARFFYPGLVFCLIPPAVYAVRVPAFKFWVWVFILAAILQTGVVLQKTYRLRHVSGQIMEAVRYLADNPPTPNRVFMYPEGNYRLFPCPHEWYLLPKYEIRELWKGNNDQRLDLLRRHKVGAVVVKKRLVGKIDAKMENLGIYPDYFVNDINSDPRFVKVLDNKDVTIYSLPAESP